MKGFTGFTKETVQFLEGLKENNSKEWFNANKHVFEQHVMEPAKAFVVEMGDALRTISPEVNAIPKQDKSIFRIYRDTRFSANKLPYKTHVGIFFWEGEAKKMECPGYYFHIEPPKLMLAGGFHCLPKHLLAPYRELVADVKKGNEAQEIIQVLKEKQFTVGGSHYKRVPRGYDPEHPHAELLKHNGLYTAYETEIPDALFSEDLIPYCMEKYSHMQPLHKWLVDNMGQ